MDGNIHHRHWSNMTIWHTVLSNQADSEKCNRMFFHNQALQVSQQGNEGFTLAHTETYTEVWFPGVYFRRCHYHPLLLGQVFEYWYTLKHRL